MNDKIERKAVSSIAEMVDRNPYLTPYITHNEKDPSWDGFINRNSEKDRTKSSFNGRVPVQVKGTLIEKFSCNYSKYNLSVNDLKSYKIDGGCILFLVEIAKDFMAYRIFFRLLLPVEIDLILPKKIKQKSVTIKLEHINHDDSREIKKIIDKFLFHNTKQLNSKVVLSKDIDNFKTKFTIFASKDNFEQTLLSEPIYLYTNLKDIDGDIFYERVVINSLETSIEKNVTVDGIIYFNNYVIRSTLESRKLIMGHSFEMDDSKVTLNLNGSLNERIHLLKFLVHANSFGCFSIDSINVNFNLEVHKEYVLHLLKEHQNIADLLNFFGITQDIKMVAVSEKQMKTLKILIDNILYGITISGIKNDNGFVNYRIDDMDILFYLLKEKENIRIIDIFNFIDERYLVNSQINMEKTEYPLILFANHIDLISAVNVKFAGFLKALKKFRITNDFIAQVNLFVLELIHSYDKSKRLEFLNLAYETIIFIEKYSAQNHIILNKMQILYRKSKLNTEDKILIRNIIDESDEIEIKLGGHILLNNSGEVEMYEELLSDEQLDEFKKYPIYLLYKQ